MLTSVNEFDLSKYIVPMPDHFAADPRTTALSNDEHDRPEIFDDHDRFERFDFIQKELSQDLEPLPLLVKFDEFLEKFPNCDLSGLKGIFEMAVAKKRLALCLYIIQKKPEILKVADENETPCIITAAKMNDAKLSSIIVKAIIYEGADVNLPTTSGITALYESSLKDTHKRVTKLLLENKGVIYAPREAKVGLEKPFAKEKLETQKENIRKALS